MHSTGSRFTLWGLGVEGVFARRCVHGRTVRNRPQSFATVRAIPVWPCLWEVLQEGSFLEASDVSLLRFAWWQAWYFATFRRVLQRVENRFTWQAQYSYDVFSWCVALFLAGAALWTYPSSFFVGRRSTLDVSRYVFLQIALAGLRQVATRCKFRGRRGILCDVLKNWWEPRTKHRFLYCQFRFQGKLVGKRRFWSYKVWRKSEEISHEMFVLVFPPISSRVSGFPVASPCYRGSCKTCSFCLVANCGKNRRSFVRNVGFSAAICLVSSRWFSCGVAVSMGKAGNLSFSNVSKQVVIFFCVAGVTLSNIPTCLVTCRTSKNGGSLVRNACFSAPMCLVSSRWFSCGVAVSMGKLYNIFFFECFQAGSRRPLWHSNLFDNVSKMCTKWFFSAPTYLVSSFCFSCGVAVFMGEASHSTPYTLQFTLHTLHLALLTPVLSLYIHTPHFTLCTPHSTLYTPHWPE